MTSTTPDSLRRTREAEMERIEAGKVGPLPDSWTAKVVGVTFVAGYPKNLHEVDVISMSRLALGDEPLAAVIVRNPANQYDANACEVHVPALGDDGMVGHLPAAVAARLAPLLDAGEQWVAEVGSVLISEENPNRPGISVHVRRP